jgi:hypothetical protein
MAGAGDKVRFALDQNYPAPVIQAFGVMMPYVNLAPVAEIDPALAELDDWELFLALHRHQPPWDGLITNDDSLLAQPKEMTVLSQTHLTLVVAKGEGHSPVRSVGLLLAHLGHICHHSRRDRAQVWKLSVAQKDYEEPRAYLERIALKSKTTVDDLVRTHKLPAKELRTLRT